MYVYTTMINCRKWLLSHFIHYALTITIIKLIFFMYMGFKFYIRINDRKLSFWMWIEESSIFIMFNNYKRTVIAMSILQFFIFIKCRIISIEMDPSFNCFLYNKNWGIVSANIELFQNFYDVVSNIGLSGQIFFIYPAFLLIDVLYNEIWKGVMYSKEFRTFYTTDDFQVKSVFL